MILFSLNTYFMANHGFRADFDVKITIEFWADNSSRLVLQDRARHEAGVEFGYAISTRRSRLITH